MQRQKQSQRTNRKPNSGKAGAIRIISGKYRGRRLPVKDVEGLRPTTDRVKETVFNWLMPYCTDANVLDCFSGSGGLAFEALSRHAKFATLIEKDKSAAQQITENIQLLQIENAKMIHGDALQTLSQVGTPHDLIFVDPPFRRDFCTQVCLNLEENNWLSDGAVVYLENEVEMGLPEVPTNWSLLKEKIAGQVAYRLYQRAV